MLNPAVPHPASDRSVRGQGKVGVLLMNLGTPEGTSFRETRRYLKQFLSDPRVIETNRVIWWIILNGIVLTTRPGRSGRAYAKIWNQARNESPLKTITREQCERLQDAFEDRDDLIVEWGMRYGQPPIAARLLDLRERGCDRILLAPLYPQYSAASTATALDAAYDGLRTLRWQPAIRTLPPYYDRPAYVGAIAGSIRAHLDSLPWRPEKLLLSYHGLPEEYVAKGDPYHRQCLETSRLLGDALGFRDIEVMTVFQSRFGRAQWLKPYADKTVAELARTGTRRIAIACPGFAADCLETLEEVAMGLKETFEENGGSQFSTVPCLNASDRGMVMLRQLVEDELQGWL